MISNPGNPTGVVLTREEMRLIADIVKEHDLFLVADEVYREFIYDDEPMGSFGELEDVKDPCDFGGLRFQALLRLWRAGGLHYLPGIRSSWPRR